MTKQGSLLTAADELTSVIGPDLAEAFIAHRKALKKPLIPQAAKIIANKLRKMSDPVAAVEKSLEHGWLTVYPVEQNGARQINMPKARGLEGLADDLRRRIDDEQGQAGARSDYPEADRRLAQLGIARHSRPN